MPRSTLTVHVAAPPSAVFDVVAHIENFSAAVPHIARVEFLTAARRGVGTRFRETRVMQGREATTELEVTEYAPPEPARIVAATHGTARDTPFSVAPREAGRDRTLEPEARARRLLPRLLNPLILPLIRKYVVADMEAVKRYCEERASGQPAGGES
mgnify:FL=1